MAVSSLKLTLCSMLINTQKTEYYPILRAFLNYFYDIVFMFPHFRIAATVYI